MKRGENVDLYILISCTINIMESGSLLFVAQVFFICRRLFIINTPCFLVVYAFIWLYSATCEMRLVYSPYWYRSCYGT